MISCKKLFLATAIALAFQGHAVHAAPLAPAATQLPDFVYQGRLDQDGTPLNGNVNLKFTLWDQQSGGTQLGDAINEANYPVSNGVISGL